MASRRTRRKAELRLMSLLRSAIGLEGICQRLVEVGESFWEPNEAAVDFAAPFVERADDGPLLVERKNDGQSRAAGFEGEAGFVGAVVVREAIQQCLAGRPGDDGRASGRCYFNIAEVSGRDPHRLSPQGCVLRLLRNTEPQPCPKVSVYRLSKQNSNTRPAKERRADRPTPRYYGQPPVRTVAARHGLVRERRRGAPE
jgi:hypothetical protein